MESLVIREAALTKEREKEEKRQRKVKSENGNSY
jgi:hypothetical protein